MATKIIVGKAVGKEVKNTRFGGNEGKVKFPYATKKELEVLRMWKEDSLT